MGDKDNPDSKQIRTPRLKGFFIKAFFLAQKTRATYKKAHKVSPLTNVFQIGNEQPISNQRTVPCENRHTKQTTEKRGRQSWKKLSN